LLLRQASGEMLSTLARGLSSGVATPEEAARREVREELGLNLSELHPLGVFTATSEYARDTVHCFCGESSSMRLKLDRDEVYEAGWFVVDDLPSGRSRQSSMVLDLYSASITRRNSQLFLQ